MQTLKDNPLKTRKDIVDAMNQFLAPLEDKYTQDHTGLNLAFTSAIYGQKTAGVEAMLRLLWGLAPLEAGGSKHAQSSKILEGMIRGTNPAHPEYWGKLKDFDQLIVEMAAIGYMMIVAPDTFWEPLTSDQKAAIVKYIKQVDEVEAVDCNWLFFAVIVNTGLKKVGEPYNQELIERNLNRIEDFYLGDGWYSDGVGMHVDYYVAFAIHFYSLIYAAEMEEDDPKRSKLYKERAAIFAKKFMYWFSEEGQGIPYGRSMTYRFAQVAFFSAYIYAEVDKNDFGWVKGMILRHFRYWFKQPMFNGDGTLSVGYTYPNLHMSEDYNAPGSPYWSFKSMLILALPEEHLFWAAKEEAFPEVQPLTHEWITEQTIVRKDGQVVMFPNGYEYLDMHNHSGAKYEKFAYSTHFGFSVPRSNLTLGEGAFDSMLALSKDELDYRVKRKVIKKVYTKSFQYMKWRPWDDVTVHTWIIPGAPMHIRVHKIETNTRLFLSDGGFALGNQPNKSLETKQSHQYAINLQNENGIVGAIDVLENGNLVEIRANSNTNLLYPNTIIPSIQEIVEPGEHTLVHGFYGSPKQEKGFPKEMNDLSYSIEDHTVQFNGNTIKLSEKE
ncbi:DUF2264 domain-containing protein [Marinilactibacillus kalidii]|uniref:DUF2264 domain-containing protein n=1 Tax=Marinilactibacillus kalidii TaxID=2820274 RepID=UPI001ABDEFE0|nr:DUF2264 domain-containing protein [Marinilactibacillus kalidii]